MTGRKGMARWKKGDIRSVTNIICTGMSDMLSELYENPALAEKTIHSRISLPEPFAQVIGKGSHRPNNGPA